MIRFCTTTPQVQAALDACLAGDIIRLDHTKTYIGSLLFRNRGIIPDNNRIIFESDADPNLLPAPGYRIKLSHRQHLPKLQTTAGIVGLRFLAGANGYLIRFIEVLPSPFSAGVLCTIGNNDSNQTEYSQIPYNITFDRVIMMGERLSGQKRGISNYGDNVEVINSHFDYFYGQGQDTSPFEMTNCRGPFKVYNNFIGSGAYGVMIGGSDPPIRTTATILASPAPTATEATFSTIKDLSIGQMIAYYWTDFSMTPPVLRRNHPYVTAINTSTNRVTFLGGEYSGGEFQAAVPDVPGDCKWGVQPRGITVRRNLFTRRPTDRAIFPDPPVVGTPVIAGASVGIAAGTWFYRVQGVAIARGYTLGSSRYDIFTPAAVEKQVVISATSTVGLTWTNPTGPDATTHRIYRYQKDGAGAIINGFYYDTTNPSTFTDTNAIGTAFTSIPGVSRWIVKNHFETKCGVDVQVDSNIFEHSWLGADQGYVIWLKSNNQTWQQPFAQCKNVTIEKNFFRNVEGFMSFSGQRSAGEAPKDNGEVTFDIIVRNNLCYLSDVARCLVNDKALWRITYDHNTFIHLNNTAMMLAMPSHSKMPNRYYTWTNNFFVRNEYGFFGNGEGKPMMDGTCQGYYTFNKNVMALNNGDGASIASRYVIPGSTNYTPQFSEFQQQFKNYGGQEPIDYKLKRTSDGDSMNSLYLGLGTDGKDIGADVDLVIAATTGVVEGLPEGEEPEEPPPPSPTGNVQPRVISVQAPLAVGPQQIDIGFAPKAVIFFYNHLGVDGEAGDFSYGKGAAFIDGTMTAGWGMSQDNVNPSDPAFGYWMDRCIGITDDAGTVIANAAVSNWGPTSFTLNWTAVDPRRPIINCLALGGIGVENGKAFTFAGRTTNGTLDVNVGFQPSLVCIFTPVHTSQSGPPLTGSKHMTSIIGYGTAPGEQWVIHQRYQNNISAAAATRWYSNNKIIISRTETAVQSEAALQAMLPTGFRLNYTTTNGFADNYLGFALKGPRCLAHNFTEPGANGVQSYNTGFKPEAIILASAVLAPPGGNTNDARFAFGAATPNNQRATIYGSVANAANPANCRSALDRTKAFKGYDTADPLGALSDADVVAYATTGYNLSWGGTPSGTQIFAVAIGGAPEGTPVELDAILDPEVELSGDLETFSELSAEIEVMNTEVFASMIITQTEAIHRSIIALFNLKVNLDVKREVDSGIIDALAADGAGTQVNFNKAYKDIDSITLAVASLTPVTATYDFTDVANPVGFKVFAHNAAGARVNATVSWKARGIV